MGGEADIETRRKRLSDSEHMTPTKAKTPAKPKPHWVGIWLAVNTPTKLEICQPIQFKKLFPDKYAISARCPAGSEAGWGKRRVNIT